MRLRALASFAALVTVVAGCGDSHSAPTAAPPLPPTTPETTESSLEEPHATGDAATWTIDTAEPPSSDAASIPVLVTRTGCSGGVTGDVLDPRIVIEHDRIVITFTVEALNPSATFTCPGNAAVRVVVDLGEPLGNRSLVDGACVDGSPAQQASTCETGPVRYEAPS